jgi:hypothetical protein
MLNLEKSYRESDYLSQQCTSYGKCSSSKLCTYIARRTMKNADMFDIDCLTLKQLTTRGAFASQNNSMKSLTYKTTADGF